MANELPHGRAPAWAVSLPVVFARPATLASLVVAGLVLLAVAIRIWLTRRIPAPWIMGDELIYSELAQSLHEHHHQVFRQQPWPFISAYPAVISPAWLAGSMDSTYSIVKALNAVLMSLVAIPVYVWARRIVSPVYAVLAVVLVLLMPVFVYVNEVMTESLAFPAVVTALLAMALALERPTVPRQSFAVAAIVLACATRLQALVLFIVLPTAIVLKVLLDARAAPPQSLTRFLPRAIVRYGFTLVLLLGGVLAYAGYKNAQGRSVHDVFGPYSGVETSGYYKFEAVARWMALHIAELQYSVGLLPASALIVLLGLAWRRGASTTPAERAFLAVAMAATPWLIFEVAAFASRYSQRIEERNMFYLAPLFLLALVVWLDKGMPRPTGLTAAAALVPAAMLILLPIEGLLNVSIMSDTFAFVPLLRVSGLFDGGTTDMRILLGLGAITVGVVFACLPRRLAMFVIPLGIAAFLALSSYSVLGTVRLQSLGALNSQGVARKDVSWVDDRVGTDADVVFVNNISLAENPHTLWQTEFWNRSIKSVVDLAVPPHIILGRMGAIDRQTGRISSDPYAAGSVRTAPYAVAPTSLELAGKVIAKPGSLLALYRVDPPLRLARTASGLYSDGWTGGEMALSQYATPGERSGSLVMRLLRPRITRPGLVGPARATLELGRLRVGGDGAIEFGGRTVKRSIRLAENRPVVLRLPAPKPPFLFQLHVTPTFSPADIGFVDTRQLGIQFSSHFVPRAAR